MTTRLTDVAVQHWCLGTLISNLSHHRYTLYSTLLLLCTLQCALRFTTMQCTALHSILLYSTLVHCVLHYILLLCNTILHNTTPYYTIPYHTISNCNTSYPTRLYSALYYTPLYFTVLHCTLLYSVIRTLLYSTVPYDTLLYHGPYYTIVLHCTILYPLYTLLYSCTSLHCSPLYSTVLHQGRIQEKMWPVSKRVSAKGASRLGGSGGMLPRKILKIWLSKTLFPAFSGLKINLGWEHGLKIKCSFHSPLLRCVQVPFSGDGVLQILRATFA